jgi:hypothetical protein
MLELATILLLGKALSFGEFWWPDESRHAMDGAYILDLLKDRPFANLYEYTVHYFVRYPALGLTWYPPFFAFIESFFFATLGISEASARVSVLVFCMFGMAYWYVWIKIIWGSRVAFFSGLLFITNPIVLLWSRSVMLETPATALIILSVLCFDHYLKRPSHLNGLLTGMSVAAMLLTKQTTAFILPVMLLYPYFTSSSKSLWGRESIWAYLIILAALAALAIHAAKFGSLGLGATLGTLHQKGGLAPPRLSLSRWLLLTKVFLEAYSWPMILLFMGGILTVFRRPRNSQDILILIWVIFWYISFTLSTGGVYHNLLRYSIYVTPAVALLASRTLYLYPASHYVHKIMLVAMIFLIIWNGFLDLKFEHPFVSGYQRAARFVMSLPDKGTTLVSLKHNGNFIFHVRKEDDKREKIVLRSDKILVSMAVHKHFGVKSYVKNKEDIHEILDRYGVGIIVVENRDLIGLPEMKLLLQTLKGTKFQLLEEFPVQTNQPNLAGIKIRVYRYLDRKSVDNGTIRIPMPHIGRELRMPVRDGIE